MLKFLIGLTLGGVATSSYLTYPNFLPDTNLSVNIIIAWAACFAAVLHYEAIKNQQKDRLWEINKSVLLELTHALSEVIEETEKTINDEYELQIGEAQNREKNNNAWGQLNKKIDYALNVYRPLMSQNLLDEIKSMRAINKKIDDEVTYQYLEHIEAYEQSLVAYNKLYSELINFIGEISRVKYT
jgi:hypothetical protein